MFDPQAALQDDSDLIEIGNLYRLVPAARRDHVRDADLLGAGVDATDVLVDHLPPKHRDPRRRRDELRHAEKLRASPEKPLNWPASGSDCARRETLCSADSADDQTAGPGLLRTDCVRAGQRLGRPLEALRLVGVKGKQRLARAHWITWLGMHFDACAGLYWILLAGAASAEPPGRDADRVGIEPL